MSGRITDEVIDGQSLRTRQLAVEKRSSIFYGLPHSGAQLLQFLWGHLQQCRSCVGSLHLRRCATIQSFLCLGNLADGSHQSCLVLLEGFLLLCSDGVGFVHRRFVLIELHICSSDLRPELIDFGLKLLHQGGQASQLLLGSRNGLFLVLVVLLAPAIKLVFHFFILLLVCLQVLCHRLQKSHNFGDWLSTLIEGKFSRFAQWQEDQPEKLHGLLATSVFRVARWP
mmetsp:Transcript_98258/g.233853  ORF Transcript_98258/g.233853 Transcript_98258/m.233853 type:complete len:226 (-) Transcript_98258:13-690(-)